MNVLNLYWNAIKVFTYPLECLSCVFWWWFERALGWECSGWFHVIKEEKVGNLVRGLISAAENLDQFEPRQFFPTENSTFPIHAHSTESSSCLGYLWSIVCTALFLYFGPFPSNLRNRVKLLYTEKSYKSHPKLGPPVAWYCSVWIVSLVSSRTPMHRVSDQHAVPLLLSFSETAREKLGWSNKVILCFQEWICIIFHFFDLKRVAFWGTLPLQHDKIQVEHLSRSVFLISFGQKRWPE